jgi:predicted amidophosphoribosyltransferase
MYTNCKRCGKDATGTRGYCPRCLKLVEAEEKKKQEEQEERLLRERKKGGR